MKILQLIKTQSIKLISFLLKFLTILELFTLIPYGIFIASKIIFSAYYKSVWIIFPIYIIVAIFLSICDRFDIPIVYHEDDSWIIDYSNSTLNGAFNSLRRIMGYRQSPRPTNLPRYIRIIPPKVCRSYRINAR